MPCEKTIVRWMKKVPAQPGFQATALYYMEKAKNKLDKCWISENDLPDWIRAISLGGLVVPSDNFVQLVQQFDQRFLQFSGKSGLHTCTDSISKLAANIVRECDCSTIDGSVVLLFARTRSFIRLRFMNAQYESVRLRKRDMKKLRRFCKIDCTV